MIPILQNAADGPGLNVRQQQDAGRNHKNLFKCVDYV